MQTPTNKIKTPMAGAEVEIKEWITGGDAEYIDQALMEGLEVKPDSSGQRPQFGKFNTETINKQVHREIECFVVSVNGNKEKVLENVKGLPEEDYEFIKKEISDKRGKKKDTTAGQQAQ